MLKAKVRSRCQICHTILDQMGDVNREMETLKKVTKEYIKNHKHYRSGKWFDELTNRQVTDKKESVSLKVTNKYNGRKMNLKRTNRTPKNYNFKIYDI